MLVHKPNRGTRKAGYIEKLGRFSKGASSDQSHLKLAEVRITRPLSNPPLPQSPIDSASSPTSHALSNPWFFRMAQNMSLFTKDTQALLYNYKDVPIQSMLDFDFVSRRNKPSIAGTLQISFHS